MVDAYLGMHSQLHGHETEEQQQEREEEADQIGRLSPLTSPLDPTPPASRKSLILGMAAQAHSRAAGLRTARAGGQSQSHGQQHHQGREGSMGTPALSRKKSDLARRSVAMITKEAV